MPRLGLLLAVLSVGALWLPAAASAAACTYTGTSGGSWHVAGNWSCNEVPDSDSGDSATVAAGSVVVSAPASAATLTISHNAKLTFTGDVTLSVTGAMNAGVAGDSPNGAGNLTGAGRVVVAGAFTKTGSGSLSITNEGTFGASAELELNGAATVSGGNICPADSGDGNADLPRLDIKSTFTIATGADTTVLSCSGGPNVFVAPTGHIVKAAAGDHLFGHRVDNDGLVTVQNGKLTLQGGFGGAVADGDYVAEAGATLQFGTCCAEPWQIGPSGRVGGAGTIVVSGDVDLAAGATFDPGALSIVHSGLELSGTAPASLPVLGISGSATLDTDRPVTATALTVTDSGTISGNGSVTVPAGGSFAKTGAGTLFITNDGATGAADLILDVDAALAEGAICAARSGDQDPDLPRLQINQDFVIGPGANATPFTCSANRVRVNGPDGHLFKSGAGTWTNQGFYEIAGGKLSVPADQTVGAANGVALTSGGVLQGAGQVSGNVTNTSGVVRPGASPGLLTIDGAYTQAADGAMETEIAGTVPGTGFDRLVVSGTASLAGTLAILNAPAFDPALTDVFEILSAGSVTGTFSTLTGASLGAKSYDDQYSATAVTLSLLPGPANTTAPSIPGAAKQGDQLSCDPGGWTGSPTFTFEWLRDGAPVATGSQYTVTADDVGKALACRVTATNSAGANQTTSNAVTPSGTDPPPPPAAPANTAAPSLPAAAQVGDTLTCVIGAWTGDPSFSIAWERNGTPIATGAAYGLTDADAGTAITCVVTATNAGGTLSVRSASVTPVAAPVVEPKVIKPSEVFTLPTTKRCVSRRNFRIRVKQPRNVTLRRVIVVVNGKTVQVNRGKRVTAPVDLRGLPKGTFRVKVTAITSTGRKISDTRRYRTCVPKRRR